MASPQYYTQTTGPGNGINLPAAIAFPGGSYNSYIMTVEIYTPFENQLNGIAYFTNSNYSSRLVGFKPPVVANPVVNQSYFFTSPLLTTNLIGLSPQAGMGFQWNSGFAGGLRSANITLDPSPPAVQQGPIVKILPILGNLFEEIPVYPPLELQPEAGPIEYPDYELGPGYFQNAFYPNLPGRPIPDGSDPKNQGLKVKTRKKMACLRRKGHIYLAIGASAVPAATQINLAGTAEWLKFTPGLANLAAAAGNQNLGIRVYKGTSNFPVGKWITGYNPITVVPDWVGNATFADLFPWEGPMTFFMEITGTAAIPAASLFEFCFDGLDLG